MEDASGVRFQARKKNREKKFVKNFAFRSFKMLSSQSREFHNFFAQLIVAATTLMVFVDFFSRKNIFAKLLHFRTFSLHSFSQKNAKFREKFANCETFCSLEALSRSPKIKHTP